MTTCYPAFICYTMSFLITYPAATGLAAGARNAAQLMPSSLVKWKYTPKLCPCGCSTGVSHEKSIQLKSFLDNRS